MAPLLIETFHMTPYLQKSAQRSRRRSPDKTRGKKEKAKDKKKKKNKNRSDFYSSPLTASKPTNKFGANQLMNYTFLSLTWKGGLFYKTIHQCKTSVSLKFLHRTFVQIYPCPIETARIGSELPISKKLTSVGRNC